MLNPKQEKFCIEYASSGNATSTYKKIYGVQDSATAQAAASRLLANPEIQKKLHELIEKTESESIANIKELQAGLTKIFRAEVTTPLMTKDGEVVQVPVSVKDRLKAAEILCKTHGAFLTRQELSISETVPIVICDNI